LKRCTRVRFLTGTNRHDDMIDTRMCGEYCIAVAQQWLSANKPKLLWHPIANARTGTGSDDKGSVAWTGHHGSALATAWLRAKPKACNGLPKF
jgi:hypothetical protein